MSTVIAVTRKELKAYFLSPIALIFIATFLLACLFAFFWVEGFFSRNVADIRPLFEWLPVMLIFLVPALGMRLWSEEERMGTMELLRTFPLRTGSMVAGKFVSGLFLVAVALGLTLPVPVTVELLGNLDWGPVIGGYAATLLVAGAYLAITLCISASTSSQIIALVFGSVACALLYAIGADPVASIFGNTGGEVLRSLGAGSRFHSILRGVLDVRDVVYYASIIGAFLLLNTWVLDSRRWSSSERRAAFRRNTKLTLALVGTNLVAFNVLLAPVRFLRLDLTENHEYSISKVTREILAGLDEPLLIRGYFSGKTHPLLAPLVPRIRDLIEEYGALGGDQVTAEFVDPTSDAEIEKEANQGYGIESVPFQFADRHEASVVNSYFHVLVKYGDQYEVLDFEDLIEIDYHGMDISVRLRNLEYDLTRSIQKTVYGFQSLESVLARLPEQAKFTAFITKAKLPPGFEEFVGRLEKVTRQIEKRSSGRFSWEIVDPDAEDAKITRQDLNEEYGFKPLALSLFSDETFYMHLLLEVGDHRERVVPPDSLTEADIRKELIASLKRAGPGSLKTVGLVTGGGEGPGMSFAKLREALGQTYQVESVDLSAGRVPGDVDVLMLLDPRELDDKKVYAVDQFLMRGGSVVLAAGSHALDSMQRRNLAVSEVKTGLGEWLESQGIQVGKEVVLDTQSAAFPIPVARNIGGFTVHEIQMLDYPAFVDVRPERMNRENPAVAGLPNVILHWPSTVTLASQEEIETDSTSEEKGKEAGESAARPEDKPESAPRDLTLLARAQVLLHSSPESWVLDDFSAQPDFDLYPELGWPVRGEQKSRPLAVALTGSFSSYFRDKEAPILGNEEGKEQSSDHGLDDEEIDEATSDGAAKEKASRRRGTVIPLSPERSRLVVIGSASFVSDTVASLGGMGISDSYLANMQFLQNMVDWCLEDIELLKIRSRGTYARFLEPTSLATRKALEWGNYGFAIAAVVLIGIFSLSRRRNAAPMKLPFSDIGEPLQVVRGETNTGTKEDAA